MILKLENYYTSTIKELKKEIKSEVHKKKLLEIKMKSKWLPDDVDYVKLDGSVHYKDGTISFIVNDNSSSKRDGLSIFLVALFDTPFEYLDINFKVDFKGICNIETIELINKESKEWLLKQYRRIVDLPDFIIHYGNMEIHSRKASLNESMTLYEYLERVFFNLNIEEQIGKYKIEDDSVDQKYSLLNIHLIKKR